ncbi:unnamed protein product [Ilex paraguariensis]|uniref:Polygalacturonase n=1 Tax=Ilex paraguariensis TaxID=185542 RepID=A0ABC8TE20_9AQUA
MKMVLQSLVVPLFIILMSCPSGFCNFQKVPLSDNLDETQNHKPMSTVSTIINRHGNFSSNFPTMVKYEKDIYRKLVQVGTKATFPWMMNVDDFGARSDRIDDSEVHGTIKASPRTSDYKESPRQWIVFKNMNNFIVEGGGTINGNGRPWWRNSCKINKNLPCVDAPTAVTFDNCINLIVANIRIKNAQQMHLTFQDCVNVKASNLKVTAPEKSPNTDGIHVTGTQNIQIMNSLIRTGDDCISIVSGSKYVRATNIICGPGHGISIGSLGKNKAEDEVSDVVVDRARISGTTNGVRIKTWQGGSGYAKNIRFQNIIMHNVTNPIIIDQNYCDQSELCPEQHSAVQVRNVVYKNIRGTSASEVAVKLDCSKTFPCSGIVLQNVNLVSEGETKAKASCQNVRLASTGSVSPLCH